MRWLSLVGPLVFTLFVIFALYELRSRGEISSGLYDGLNWSVLIVYALARDAQRRRRLARSGP